MDLPSIALKIQQKSEGNGVISFQPATNAQCKPYFAAK